MVLARARGPRPEESLQALAGRRQWIASPRMRPVALRGRASRRLANIDEPGDCNYGRRGCRDVAFAAGAGSGGRHAAPTMMRPAFWPPSASDHRFIKRGGMGVVYEASNRCSKRRSAQEIHFPAVQSAAEPEAKDEVQLARSIRLQVCSVFDFWEHRAVRRGSVYFFTL